MGLFEIMVDFFKRGGQSLEVCDAAKITRVKRYTLAKGPHEFDPDGGPELPPPAELLSACATLCAT
jgi:hypothetical protein